MTKKYTLDELAREILPRYILRYMKEHGPTYPQKVASGVGTDPITAREFMNSMALNEILDANPMTRGEAKEIVKDDLEVNDQNTNRLIKIYSVSEKPNRRKFEKTLNRIVKVC